jgi:crotonobetainyl-CoA:carnitine CoA-transferase CaiB-like acyl-CoA transferase
MPPRLGEQTASVLGELLDLDADAVKALKDKGVV